MTYFENISVEYQNNLIKDTVGRLRTSFRKNIFTSTTTYDKRLNKFDELTLNGGTSNFIINNNCVNLNTTTTSGSRAVRQTKEYFYLEPGKSFYSNFGFQFGTRENNVIKRVGLFDDANGIFFQQSISSLSLKIRSFVTGTAIDIDIPQTIWNMDKLDGNGLSGLTFDETKIQSMFIDFCWNGTLYIRFGFNINELHIICHEYYSNNITSIPILALSYLPIRYEIITIGTASANATLKIFSTSIDVEKENEQIYPSIFSVETPTTVTTNNGASVPLLAIRLKSSFNKIEAILNELSILIVGTNPINYKIYLNPTINGTWVSVDNNSCIEYNSSLTTITGGTVLKSGFVSAQLRQATIDLKNLYKFTTSINGTSDIIVIWGSGVGGHSSVRASINWIEKW